jgi:tetratricopeptide (TPR) repeat protein
MNPQFAEAYSNRGAISQRKGNIEASLQDLTKAISLTTKNGFYYFNRAIVYFQKGNFAAANADFTKAIEFYPLWKTVYLRRAEVYKKLNQNKLAEADLRKAKEVEKENFSPFGDGILLYLYEFEQN